MCNFYKSMNKFFLNLAKFILPIVILSLPAGFIYVLYLSLFDVRAASQVGFYDVMFFIATVAISLLLCMNIIEEFEPDYLKIKSNESNKEEE